jgi:hypothetical protein
MCMNSRADTVMTDDTVVALWKTLVLESLDRIDPIRAMDVPSLWVGFVIGLERYDLGNIEGYTRLGAASAVEHYLKDRSRERALMANGSRFGG